MNRLPMIEFGCPVCHEELEVSQQSAGKEKLCPACNAPVSVPEARQVKDEAPPPQDKEPVKVRMGIGRLGGIETSVSKQDAGRMAHTFLGGMLALLGVMVCAMLGLRMPKTK